MRCGRELCRGRGTDETAVATFEALTCKPTSDEVSSATGTAAQKVVVSAKVSILDRRRAGPVQARWTGNWVPTYLSRIPQLLEVCASQKYEQNGRSNITTACKLSDEEPQQKQTGEATEDAA